MLLSHVAIPTGANGMIDLQGFIDTYRQPIDDTVTAFSPSDTPSHHLVYIHRFETYLDVSFLVNPVSVLSLNFQLFFSTVL
jgi:hypothetical protein